MQQLTIGLSRRTKMIGRYIILAVNTSISGYLANGALSLANENMLTAEYSAIVGVFAATTAYITKAMFDTPLEEDKSNKV